MVDVDLTVRGVQGIYMYRKDYTVESTIFTPWSKKVIPFPPLRWKIQVFQDDKRQNTMIPWNDGNTVQFSTPPEMPRNVRKHTTGKISCILHLRTQIGQAKTGTVLRPRLGSGVNL